MVHQLDYFLMVNLQHTLHFLTKTCENEPIYRQNSQLIIFTIVGIAALLWQSGILESWSYDLYRSLLDCSANSNVCILNLPSNEIPNRQKRDKTKHRNWYGNLAFGGRGPPYFARKEISSSNDTVKFNATMGYPGEGWDKLKFATWNCRSITFERFNFCKALGYDVLALTELWHNQNKFQTASKQFIISEQKTIQKGPNKGKPRFPNDKAAGVAIMLSNRMRTKIMSFGSEGNRVCWVRLRGPSCNLFVIAVYLPHRGRVSPSQDDTLTDVQTVISKIPARDCICLLGDFNEQLQKEIKGVTGKWTGGPPSANSEKIVQFLRLNNLIAANTTFQPKQNSSVCTFLQTTKKGNTETKVNDFGAYVNQEVKTKYKNKWFDGVVEARESTGQGQPRWVVRFQDGHITRCDEKTLRKMLVYTQREQTGRQLDYVMVSRRWATSIENCRVRWGPSIHRNVHGVKSDHALLSCTWKWKIRTFKKQLSKDYDMLLTQYDDEGLPKVNEHLVTFSNAVNEKLADLNHQEGDTTDKLYNDITTAIHHAVKTLPDIKRQKREAREVSQRTKDLIAQRSNGRRHTEQQFKELQAKIKDSSLQDFKNWVEKKSCEMDQANERGDTKKIYQIVNTLASKSEAPPRNLVTDGQGNMLGCATDVANRWYNFLKNKFAATQAEQGREMMPPLPPTQGVDELSDKEITDALSKLKGHKACGPDAIPVEIYKRCPRCKELLILLIKSIWNSEDVPTTFAEATFTMLFKNKGSSDNPKRYRCIGLLNHSYKILSLCLLARLTKETESYLSEWQAGFRSKRGCRDNVLTLRAIYESCIRRDEKLFVTFIDYTAAFDSVSHKFLDKALDAAGASNKCRSIFRAIYSKATARTKVSDTDGKTVLSDAFPVRRGVVQGDITSPLYFILALELILKTHDNMPNKGVLFGALRVSTLGYADDAALLDNELATASKRVTAIAQGSRRDADMEISIPKTEVMHVCPQGKVSTTTAAEARKVCKFKCMNIGCNRVFNNVHGMKCHAGKCRWKNFYHIEKILAARGAPGDREFLIKWEGYGSGENRWVHRKNIVPHYVVEFLKSNGLYDYNRPDELRCPWCDKACKSKFGVRIHMKSCKHSPAKEQQFQGTCADKQVKLDKIKSAQSTKTAVQCEGQNLINVFTFKYLGSIFAANGSHTHDVKRRCAMASSRFGALRHIFNSPAIPLKLKMKVYHTAVCSLLTYGSEAWNLTGNIQAMINGCNSRCLSHITGKSAHSEASVRTRTYDLVGAIRQRRYRWLGHILRMPNNRLVKEAVKVQFHAQLPGNMFMDTPPGMSFDQLVQLANDRKKWREGMPTRTQTLPEHTHWSKKMNAVNTSADVSHFNSDFLVPRSNISQQSVHLSAQMNQSTLIKQLEAQFPQPHPQPQSPQQQQAINTTINMATITTTPTITCHTTSQLPPLIPPTSITPTTTRQTLPPLSKPLFSPTLFRQPPPIANQPEHNSPTKTKTIAKPQPTTSPRLRHEQQLKAKLCLQWRRRFNHRNHHAPTPSPQPNTPPRIARSNIHHTNNQTANTPQVYDTTNASNNNMTMTPDTSTMSDCPLHLHLTLTQQSTTMSESESFSTAMSPPPHSSRSIAQSPPPSATTNCIQGHLKQLEQDTAQPPPFGSLSPIIPPIPFKLNLTPTYMNVLNVPQPYLNAVCSRYPHLNQSYLIPQYFPYPQSPLTPTLPKSKPIFE